MRKLNFKNNKDLQEEMVKRQKETRTHFANAASSVFGIDLFRNIMHLSGYCQSSVDANPQTGEIYQLNTLYNEGRRSIWLDIRKLLPPEQLALIEQTPMPQQEEEHEDGE